MAEESPLLQKLSEVVARVRTVEREKDELFARFGTLQREKDECHGRISMLEREKEEHLARIGTLEREINEFRALIAMAESKAEELLQSNTPKYQRVPDNVGTSTAGKGIQDLVGKASAGQPTQGETRRPFQPF
jgi:chromosome segregation ATPase